jgi:hypothetical protein
MIEAQVFQRLGTLKGTTAVTSEARFKQVPKTADADDDAAFSPISVRLMIVDVTLELISYICKTEGDPRRIHYQLTASLNNGDGLPASMGPYGAAFDPITGTSMVERSATDIFDILKSKSIGAIPASSEFYFYAMDGSRVYHTLPGFMSLQHYDILRPGANFNAVESLFATQVNISPIPDDLAVVVADGAAGRCCMKAASYIEEGQRFLDVYATALRERGFRAEPSDFPPQPRS